jgi:hypothetical protein
MHDTYAWPALETSELLLLSMNVIWINYLRLDPSAQLLQMQEWHDAVATDHFLSTTTVWLQITLKRYDFICKEQFTFCF